MMAHPHMVGGFRMHTAPAFGTPAMAKPRPIRGKVGDGRGRLLHILLRIGVHLGHSGCQHADLSGHVYHDQEAVCQGRVYVLTCVYQVMRLRHEATHDT